MKNWKRFLSIAVLVCFAVALVPVEAHADALTAAMIGGLAYGVASGMGITFTAGNATGTGMSDFMAGQVESYVNEKGGSLSSLFQGSAAVTAAGKLLMANNLYNGLTTFIDWLADKTGLKNGSGKLTDGEYQGTYLPTTEGGTTGEITGIGLEAQFTSLQTSSNGKYQGYRIVNIYSNGRLIKTWSNSGSPYYDGTIEFWVDGNILVATMGLIDFNVGYKTKESGNLATVGALNNSLSWTAPPDWAIPQPLPDDKSMEQTYRGPGFADPTDLPDFLSRIPAAVADGTLDVVDSIVDTGGGEPTPTPSPSPSPTPSGPKVSIADKIAIIIGEIIGILYDTTGDTATETIDQLGDEVQDITQTVTDAITETQISTSEQTQTEIKDATTTITETITDTTTEIKDAIQDQTQTQEDIKDALQDLTDVPQDWEPQKRPLLRGVFPFCIPFDLHDFILALSAEPQTPEIHVPFDLQLPLPGGNFLPFHYQFDLDLHDFDGLAQVLRTLEFIAFGVGLLFVTGKVIKW